LRRGPQFGRGHDGFCNGKGAVKGCKKRRSDKRNERHPTARQQGKGREKYNMFH